MFKPTSYTGPADIDKLQTEYQAYIPSDQVDALANQLLAKTSQFYSPPSPYNQLASHVLSTFPVTGGSTSNNADSGDGSSGASSNSGASSGSNKTRENAIIGVISSLGAITLIVLTFLAVRAFKQRRALAHRRLSDPPRDPNAFVGSRPENQDFDRDTLGGQRRRSFYYAEDSLRGFEDVPPPGMQQQQGMSGMQQMEGYDAGMRERRPVNAAMISTPVLRDNTMNW